jgi:membrane protein
VQEEPLNQHQAKTVVAPDAPGGMLRRLLGGAGRVPQAFHVAKRVAVGTWDDGFIHAGNLAYLAIFALFPFLIVLAAILSAIGEQGLLDRSIAALLTAVPRRVAELISPVAHDVATARQGWLLWVGALVGLWTASSLIETIRDILRRAYRTPQTVAFWRYRLASTGIIFGSVILLLIALSGQVAIAAAEEVVFALFPGLNGIRSFDISRLASAAVLFVSIYLLFVTLTPRAYQKRRYPKWPGALAVTIWWTLVTLWLPRVLRTFFTYDLTYGSLAGVMIALFFFWLVGLGMVVGAELNAALAELREGRDKLALAGEAGAADRAERREGSG